jgi:xylono-1,5-lactonase
MGQQAEGDGLIPAVDLVWAAECLLGEGPVWLPDEDALRFVDIKAGRLYRYHPASGSTSTLDVGGQPSFIVPAADGGLLVGSGQAIWRLNEGQRGEDVVNIPEPAHNRTNDATVDDHGRLWFGTMDDKGQRQTGRIWCLDRNVLRDTDLSAVVTNGPAAGADPNLLYHVDSVRGTIWRHRIADNAMLCDAVTFVQFDPADGSPDGIVLDSEKCLWVAMWGGWCVKRYSAAGELLLTVPLPCARVTKVAFGGADLCTAYVTTARNGLDEAEIARQPLAGGLFSFRAPVPGRTLAPVRLA